MSVYILLKMMRIIYIKVQKNYSFVPIKKYYDYLTLSKKDFYLDLSSYSDKSCKTDLIEDICDLKSVKPVLRIFYCNNKYKIYNIKIACIIKRIQ